MLCKVMNMFCLIGKTRVIFLKVRTTRIKPVYMWPSALSLCLQCQHSRVRVLVWISASLLPILLVAMCSGKQWDLSAWKAWDLAKKLYLIVKEFEEDRNE